MTVWGTCSQISLPLALCVTLRALSIPFPVDASVVCTAKPLFVYRHSWEDSSIKLHPCTVVLSIIWVAASLNL